MSQSLSNFYVVFYLVFHRFELDQFSFTFVFYFQATNASTTAGRSVKARGFSVWSREALDRRPTVGRQVFLGGSFSRLPCIVFY